MKNRYDIAVIGAGPAGIAAATLAASHGASVVLVDEQSQPGGQVYRNLLHQSIEDKNILDKDYYRGRNLLRSTRDSNIDYIPGATVWQISPELEIGMSNDGKACLFHALQVIIATGALERPFPVPGWTLPGVMQAGAAQTLLKTSGVVIPDAVFIGTGPLLYLIACQYLRAGVTIEAILDVSPRDNYWRALPYLPKALLNSDQLIKGFSWLNRLRNSGVSCISSIEEVRFTGKLSLECVDYRRKGQWHHIETRHALVHQGVVPNTNLAMAAGCEHSWSDSQLCWHAETDYWAESSVPAVMVAGDGAGIFGAGAAEHSGRIAALGALYRSDIIDVKTRDRLAAPARRRLIQGKKIRPFLDVLFRPPMQFRVPVEDATLVCRCEEVSAGDIRAAILHGCSGPNRLKSFSRCGMGPCQGRLCGLTVCELMAQARDVPVAAVGPLRLRPPVKPLPLAELVNLAEVSAQPPNTCR